MKEKSLLAEKFFDRGKIIALCLLKMKSYNETNASVETINIYISKSGGKT